MEEVRFARQEVPYLDKVLEEARSQELTQELRLPEGMPDVGKVLGAWGQPILRSKEWNGSCASASGGMQVWILYTPGDGSSEQCMEGWIPFQMRWDLPPERMEGKLNIRCLPRFVDARSVTPRKLMIRAGLGVLAGGWVPSLAEVFTPERETEGVELRQHTWPVQLAAEAGEKAFALEEELTLPSSMPVPEKILFCRMEPKIREQRVVGDRLAFRGSGNLHMLCRSGDGQIYGWESELPFSQLAELDRAYGPDARAELTLAMTALEPELLEENRLRIRCGITGQYIISQQQMLPLADDAYSPHRFIEMEQREMELPVVLEERTESLSAELELDADADMVASITFLPDIPRQKRTEEGLEIRLPGQFQVLYYTPGCVLQGTVGRWEGKLSLPAGEETIFWMTPETGEPARGRSAGGKLLLNAVSNVAMNARARQSIPMVTGISLGEVREKDPERPSLILRRAGDAGLWDMAKAAGTTVDAIRRANGLTEEPAPGKMLLIPVP